MVWKPHVTVAAVVELEGRFLVVEEEVHGERVFNNPAGHLESGESFLDAVRREALEETGWDFLPDSITGIYLWKNPKLDASFVRVAFHGMCGRHHAGRALEKGIIAAHWLTRTELAGMGARLRSPMVLRCIDDYLTGRRYSLELLCHINDPDSVLEDA